MLKTKRLIKKPKREVSNRSVQDTIKILKSVLDFLRINYLERESVIRQMFYALLTKQHCLMKGQPGTAKSAMIKSLLTAFTDAKLFSITMSKYLPEEALIGALNPKRLREEGIYEYNTTNTIVDCDYAYVDEAFDANDATLRSLLEILNERTFSKGHQQIACPLRSSFLSSNFIRQETNIQAFVDRIIFKSELEPLSDQANRLKMFTNYLNKGNIPEYEGDKLSLRELDSLFDKVVTIPVSEEILDLYCVLLREFKSKMNCYISDRKSNLMLRVLQASALLNNRDTVDVSDLKELRYVMAMIGNTNEETVFDGIYAKYIESLTEVDVAIKKIKILFDENTDKLLKVKSPTLNDVNILKEMNNAIENFKTNILPKVKSTRRFSSVEKIMNKYEKDLEKVTAYFESKA